MDITYEKKPLSRLSLKTIKVGVPFQLELHGDVYIKLEPYYITETKHHSLFNLTSNSLDSFHKEVTVYCYYPRSNLILDAATDIAIHCE